MVALSRNNMSDSEETFMTHIVKGKNSFHSVWQRALDNGFTIFMWAFLVFVFIVTTYPFWHVIMVSLSDLAQVTNGFLLIPNGFSIEAYMAVFSNDRFINALFISVARSTIGPVISGVITMMIAYGLSQRVMPGRRFLNWYFLFTMYFSAGLIPTYLLFQTLGFVGSFWVYVIPPIVNVFGMILMRTYIESLPAELRESALIDGANDFIIFVKIVVPLCTPVIAAVTLFSVVHQWNAYTDTVIYNSMHEHLHTLQYFLVRMVDNVAGGSSDAAMQLAMQAGVQGGQARLTPQVVRMAVTVVTIVPIACVYPFMQRYFVKGMMVGAVKG